MFRKIKGRNSYGLLKPNFIVLILKYYDIMIDKEISLRIFFTYMNQFLLFRLYLFASRVFLNAVAISVVKVVVH